MKIKEVKTLETRKKSLAEAMQNSRRILAESCVGLTAEQEYVVTRMYNEFRPLVEAVLTQDQINNIFKGVEQGATAGGNNRTMIGKGVDVAKEVNKVMDQVGTWLQDTAPVQFFDKKFEELKNKVKAGLGEDSKTMGYINALGQAAKDNPGTTAAVIGLLTIVAGLAASPAAATLVAYTLRAGVDLVKGEKLSTAVGHGLKTAAITWLTGKAFELVKNAVIAVADRLADLVNITTNISPVNEVVGNVNMNVNVDGQNYIDVSGMPMLKADYTQLDGLKQSFYDAMPPGGNGADAAAALQAFNAKLAELTTAEYAQKVAEATASAGADSSTLAFATYDTVRDGMNQVGDALQAVAQGTAAGVSAMPNQQQPATAPADKNAHPADDNPNIKLGNESAVKLLPGQQRAIFEAVQYIYEEPSLLAKIQQGATNVLNKLSVKGGNLTNKITADKLQQAWVKAGKPMDSDDIMDFLVKQGVDKTIAGSTFDSLSIPRAQPAAKKTAPAQQPAPAAETPPSADPNAAQATPATPTTPTTEPTATAATAETPPATPAPEVNSSVSIFADYNRLRSTWEAFKQTGASFPIALKAQLGDMLKTAFNTVESRRILNTKLIKLTEAKARIDHPEDLVFEEGSAGALRALDAILHAAQNPSVNTVKWDGTPAIIFGRDEQGFILTDKAGFGAKKYDGMARSQKMFQDMIFNRKPDEPSRMEYATQIAKLYPMLEKIVPVSFRGFIQGDIMWMSQPVVHDGVIEIQPLKVKYTIDAKSDLGKKIKSSQAGVVVHSYFTDRAEEEPRAMTPEEIKKLKPSPGLVVLSPVMKIESVPSFNLEEAGVKQVRDLITKNKAAIDKLLDSMSITTLKISNLPDIFKSFLNFKAYRGEHAPTPKEFLAWLQSPDSKLTVNKLQNVMDHINKNKTGFTAVFQVANALVNLKYELKHQLDTHASQDAAVTASVREHPGHEGFVADTPHGKIKLVNRPVFMKKV